MNENGALGLGVNSYNGCVMRPRRVLIDCVALDVCLTPEASFFRTDFGWHGCGNNWLGQLGLGNTSYQVTTPTPIPGSEGVTRWAGDEGVMFAFNDDGLLACGSNCHGQCGVGSTDDAITTLTPVALPDDVKGRVDRVVCDGVSSFFVTCRRRFVCGNNWRCRLRQQAILAASIRTPIELPPRG